jgi:hypothetical protein
MIELTGDKAFERGSLTRWYCTRCNQGVPDHDNHGDRLEYVAATVRRRSTCRLIITVVGAALVGGLTVGTMERLLDQAPAVDVSFAVFRLVIGGSAWLLLYSLGAFLLGMVSISSWAITVFTSLAGHGPAPADD